MRPILPLVIALLGLTGCGVSGPGAPTTDTEAPVDADEPDDTAEVVHGYKWKAVSAGWYTACGITIEGGIVCWGGSKPAGFPSVLDVPVGSDFVSLSVFGNGACALDIHGLATCWGVMAVMEPPPSDSLLHLAVAKGFACGVRASDGSIVCWGEQQGYGGDPTRPDLIPEGDFVQVALDDEAACALRRTGEIVCWNHEWYAQREDATEWGHPDYDVPLVPTRAGFVQVDFYDGARTFGCAVDDAGEVECWARSFEQPPSPARAVSVDIDGWCSLGVDGKVTCSGASYYTSPPDATFTQIDLGSFFGCGVTVGADMLCWGDGWAGSTTPPK